MNIFESAQSAFSNVFANKLRTFLTMLGIIIGISSVITIVAIGEGSQQAIEAEFDSFGTGTLSISTSSSADLTREDLLEIDDYYEILDNVDGISLLAPIYRTSAYVKLLDPRETNSTDIIGTSNDYMELNNHNVLYGNYISDNDVEMRNNTAVIYDTTAVKVFGEASEDVIGQQIKVENFRGTTKLTVVGIIENTDENQIENPDDYSDTIIMPASTAMKVFSSSTLSSISLMAEDLEQVDAVGDNAIAAIESRHENVDKYSILDTTDMVESINSILSYVTMFIGFVAAISLLVGGIGVMNIMMVTVTERTREIGIRKAIGAKNKDIRIQFIIEAIVLTGIGGLLGLLIGFGASYLVGGIVGITPVMSLTAIVAAVGISMGIGIIFGVAPANKAAMLDPIEALRYE